MNRLSSAPRSAVRALASLLLAAACSATAQTVLFEAERWTSPASAWQTNSFSKERWNLWSTDRDAMKKWSEGVVLQSPIVPLDRAAPEEGAPPLHTRITGIPTGAYAVDLRVVGRPLAVSFDGRNWSKKQGSDRRLGVFDIDNGTFEVWVDDRFAATPPGSSYYDALIFTRAAPLRLGISNGDFEADGDRLPGWIFASREDQGSATPASDAHAGHHAARIRSAGSAPWSLDNIGRLDVKSGQVFTATAWLKGKGGVGFSVIGFANGQPLRRSLGSDSYKDPDGWEQLLAEARIPQGCDQIQVRLTGRGDTDLLVDDVVFTSGARPRPVKPKVEGFARKRVREKLNRGLIATPLDDNKIYLGWRLLEVDERDVAFNIYRQAGRSAPERLNERPIRKTTDFVDVAPPTGPLAYFVRPVVKGREGAPSDNASADASSPSLPYLRIKLDGNHTFQKAGIADLDGDGRLDFVIKQPNSNVDPYVKYWKKSLGTYQLEAWSNDGRLLWRRDLGWAIEQGI